MTIPTLPDAPERYRRTAIAHLMVDGVDAAIRFYAEAFGAEELFRVAGPGGQVQHAEIRVGGAVLMVGDADGRFSAPTAAGTTTVGVHVYVPEVDRFAERAVATGAELLQPPTDMFYGDRTIMLRDPFGHVWVFLAHQEDLPTDEIARRGAALLAAG